MWVHDRLVKIECQACFEEFLVSEYVLKKKTDEEYPGDGCCCPYCGSVDTEAIVWTGDDQHCMDFVEEMGCLAISHPEKGVGEELKMFKLKDTELGISDDIEALDFFHAVEIFRKKHKNTTHKITGELISQEKVGNN